MPMHEHLLLAIQTTWCDGAVAHLKGHWASILGIQLGHHPLVIHGGKVTVNARLSFPSSFPSLVRLWSAALCTYPYRPSGCEQSNG
jgi:hypothetical protein